MPDGEVGQQAFAVIREAIRKEGMVALGKVVFTSREHIIALEARGKGLMGLTVRYPYEVRNEKDYFDDIEDKKVPNDMLELASHIVDTKRGEFDPQKFEDRYEDALKELLRKKQKGEKIERPKEGKPSDVVDLMEALRQSVSAEKGGGGDRRILQNASPHRQEVRPYGRAASKGVLAWARPTKSTWKHGSKKPTSLGRSRIDPIIIRTRTAQTHGLDVLRTTRPLDHAQARAIDEETW